MIHHRGWPAPLWYPRVTEFAIASQEEGDVWELRTAASAGRPARHLAIVYGEVPPGFVQVFPESDAKPRRLEAGRNYFVAAGGSSHVYRIAFALPQEYWRPIDARPSTAPADVAGAPATSAPPGP